MRKLKFYFSEVDVSLGFFEFLAACGLGAMVVAGPLIFKAVLLALGG